LLLLTIRWTNVFLTIEGILGIVITSLINYMFMYMTLKNLRKEEVNKNKVVAKTIYKITMMLIPVYLIAITFIFATVNNSIASLGMTLMWGIVAFYIYNFIATNLLFYSIEKEA